MISSFYNFNYANHIELIHKYQKDLQIINICVNKFTKLFINIDYNKTQLINEMFYWIFININKNQTLGEEYCYLYKYNSIDKIFINKKRNFLYCVLKILSYYIIKNIFSKNEINERIFNILKLVNEYMFFKYGFYYEFINRFCNIQYLNVFQFGNKHISYNKFSYVILLIVLFKLKEFYIFLRKIKQNNINNKYIFIKKYNNTINYNNCHLCLDKISNITITICGHMYCFKCIYELSKITGRCAICNLNIDSNSLIRIYNL